MISQREGLRQRGATSAASGGLVADDRDSDERDSPMLQRRHSHSSAGHRQHHSHEYDEIDDDKYRVRHNRRHTGTGQLMTIVSRLLRRYVTAAQQMLESFALRSASSAQAPDVAEPFTQAALDCLESSQKTRFEEGRPDHEDQLHLLWTTLLPDEPFQRTSKLWSQLGFQGKDPVTDLRGQGMLGLRNMVYFSQQHHEKAVEFLSRNNTFPFGLAAINISAFLLALVTRHHSVVGRRLFGGVESGEQALDLFDQLFSLVFIEFEEFHRAAVAEFIRQGGPPELAVMQFNAIRKEYFDELGRMVGSGDFSDNFVERCEASRERSATFPVLRTPRAQPIAVGNLIDFS